ncbi:DUF3846 domain-containing protein [Dysosmobacter sp.]|jgi:hypothetical protein|uniref:DUF3846 domain-containing protein n=1 Tax=Dysosmobacter sp. TaxID=2591382 RepID=UPI003D93FA92
MQVLVIEPQQPPRKAEIPHTLEAMQALVGGTIQAVYPFADPVALVCNDEGKLLHLPWNRALRTTDTGAVYDIVAGTFFLCGAPADSESFTSLTAEQMTRYTKLFQKPEYFLPTKEGLLIMPSQSC